jgi:hypothetical protein
MSDTPLDANHVDAFPFTGQDSPLLLSHWAKNKPDPPFLIWEPKLGEERCWSYAAFTQEVADVAVGLAAKGVKMGEKPSSKPTTAPRWWSRGRRA